MLLLSLLCACQVAVATVDPLAVRTGDRARSVPAMRHPAGGIAVQAQALVDAIGARLVPDGGARYHVQVDAARIDLTLGGGFAIAGGDTVPLAGTVFMSGGQLYLPFAFVSEALPRLAGGLLFDNERRELRRFGAVTAPRASASRASAPRGPTTQGTASPARLPQPPAQRGTGATEPGRAPTRPGASRHVVVVDAGHGGPDRGMSGPIGAPRKVFEKDITLAVAQQLRAALERRGIGVVMTRTTDTLIALGDRGRIANQAKGELFMSIHVNAANPRWSQPGTARGFETYFLAEAKTEDERRVEAMENEAIRFETSVDASRDDPLGFIIRDMAQNEHLRESARLAELVQRGLASIHPGPNRGVKQAGFRVLVTAFMPAVLVEIGFGSNRAESEYMTDPVRQRALAETLADAAVRYLEQYERKVGGGT